MCNSSLIPRGIFVSAFTLLLLVAGASADTTLDFATDSNNDGTPDTTTATLGGAIFNFSDIGGGTGNISSFVQIQGPNSSNPAAVERAYNTTTNNVLDNGNSNNFNRDVRLGDIPIVEVNGVQYFEVLLDINENASAAGDQFLSLDALQVYTTDAAGQSIDPTTGSFSNEVLRYDLDSTMNNEVLLDFSHNTGSGTIDLTVLIPVWANPDGNDYFILYSEFGAHGSVTFNGDPAEFSYSDGFEEWAVRTTAIVTLPEPGSLVTFTLAMFLLDSRRFRRRRKR